MTKNLNTTTLTFLQETTFIFYTIAFGWIISSLSAPGRPLIYCRSPHRVPSFLSADVLILPYPQTLLFSKHTHMCTHARTHLYVRIGSRHARSQTCALYLFYTGLSTWLSVFLSIYFVVHTYTHAHARTHARTHARAYTRTHTGFNLVFSPFAIFFNSCIPHACR